MQAELVTWRPLFEFGMIAFVLGVVGVASRPSLSTWLVSQGLLLLGAVLGLTAFSAVHHRPEGHTLAMWVIAAWAVQMVVVARTNGKVPNDEVPRAAKPQPMTNDEIPHDERMTKLE
jgi:NADH:ubiquinone oxidoreductase subunit K